MADQRYMVKYIAERKETDIGPFVRIALRPARLTDWARVCVWWTRLVWRDFHGARITPRAAWDVAELLVGIVRGQA